MKRYRPDDPTRCSICGTQYTTGNTQEENIALAKKCANQEFPENAYHVGDQFEGRPHYLGIVEIDRVHIIAVQAKKGELVRRHIARYSLKTLSGYKLHGMRGNNWFKGKKQIK